MLRFLGHAGFLYETEKELLLMDPWMSREGAFDNSWYQFPPNHKYGDKLRKVLSETDKNIYIYISHEHKDHFDIPFLETLELSNINFITPKFRRDHVASVLSELNPLSVTTPIDSELVEIGNLEIRLFLDDQEIVRDSAIGLLDKETNFTFLNLNDCKVYDRVDELKQLYRNFDIFTCQFSGAVFHPVCYDYNEKKYSEISESKVYGKFNSVKNILAAFNPTLYIPAAGPPVFLDPDLIDINFQEVNIFSSPFLFKEFLSKELPNLKVEVPVPQSSFIYSQENIKIEHPVSDVQSMFDKSLINDYAKEFENTFLERKSNLYDINDVQKKLFRELSHKLDGFKIQEEMKAILEFSLEELASSSIFIDFNSSKISIAQDYQVDSSYMNYKISASVVDIGRLLDGICNWEDFMLSFRHKLHRTPDIYQVAINGFLTMEKEDVPSFVENLMRLQNQRERITVEAGGTLYSVDKFCPHQGSDLTTHQIEDERFLICPKHRWAFDLENDGKALNAEGSINAIDLDGDGS